MGPLNPANQAGSYNDGCLTQPDDQRSKRPSDARHLHSNRDQNKAQNTSHIIIKTHYFGALERPGSGAGA